MQIRSLATVGAAAMTLISCGGGGGSPTVPMSPGPHSGGGGNSTAALPFPVGLTPKETNQ